MTPRKQAAKRKADWALALKEGRVVRYGNGERLTSYPTVEAANDAMCRADMAGYPAEIVRLSPSPE